MVILQQYKSGEPKTPITEDVFLDRTEGNGWWAKGTALQTLKDAGTICTPWAYYTIEKSDE